MNTTARTCSHASLDGRDRVLADCRTSSLTCEQDRRRSNIPVPEASAATSSFITLSIFSPVIPGKQSGE